MKIWNEKHVQEIVTVRSLDRVICDWCGAVIPPPTECKMDTSKTEVRIEFYPKTSIEFNAVHTCYDSGMSEGWMVEDLCLTCGAKLGDVLKNLGITVTTTEADW